jgi:protein-S-isoprenylcysteine O-methyltransferase Ste14
MFHALPAFLIGILVAAYWLRVIHLARKIRRRIGRTANVLPPGTMGMITRIVWFPVVVLWIALPISTFFFTSPPWLLAPLFVSPAISWGALAVAVIAFILTLICWKKMGTSWRMGIDPNEKTQLIVTGPFARIRHPIYALSSLLMLATAAADPAPLMLVAAGIHLCLLRLEAYREEKYLAAVHPDFYPDYCSRTGGFFPKLAVRAKSDPLVSSRSSRSSHLRG